MFPPLSLTFWGSSKSKELNPCLGRERRVAKSYGLKNNMGVPLWEDGFDLHLVRNEELIEGFE